MYLRSSLATALSQLISYLNLGGDAEISMPGMGQSLLKGMQMDAGTWCAENSETTTKAEVESLKNYHPDVLSNVGKGVHFLVVRGRGGGWGVGASYWHKSQIIVVWDEFHDTGRFPMSTFSFPHEYKFLLFGIFSITFKKFQFY